MARLGFVRSGKKELFVAFHENKCYALSNLLKMEEKEISQKIYEIGMKRGAEIEVAIQENVSMPLSSFRYLTPIPAVHSIRDFYAFEEHVKAGRRNRGLDMIPEWYEIPVFYYSGVSSLFANLEEIPYPNYSQQLDFELELGFVIGKEGINIRKEDAIDHIFGVTVVNDWSARDVQIKEMLLGLGPAKAKDFATSIGPSIMTIDSLLDRRQEDGRFNIHMEAFVNHKKYSDGNLATIYHNIDSMIERASMGTRLFPGDILMTGTVGTGCIFELGPEKYGWIERGDIVELKADGIGSLINKVI